MAIKVSYGPKFSTLGGSLASLAAQMEADRRAQQNSFNATQDLTKAGLKEQRLNQEPLMLKVGSPISQ